MNYFEKAISSINEIFAFIGASLSPSQIDFLESNSVSRSISPARTYEEQISLSPLKELPLPSIDQILNSEKLEESFSPYIEINELLSDIAHKFLKAFFKGSEYGYHYLDPTFISNRFGKTISEAYPGSSTEFVTFAESFWTLKLLHDEIVISHKDLNVTLLYGWLEFNIGSVFFPAGGGHPSIPLQQRINAQREILRLVGYQEIEGFISGNPMLRNIGNTSKKSATRSGCLGVFVILSFILFLIAVGFLKII